MKIVSKDGSVSDFVYQSHDRWLDDYAHFLKAEFTYSVIEGSMADLLDRVSAHLNHWMDKKDEAPLNKTIQENQVLARVFNVCGSIIQPELIIYEFGGRSIYDEIQSEDISYDEKSKTLEIKLYNDAIFEISQEDFEDIGGEIILPEDEDEEIEFEYSIGEVYFFMTDDQEEELRSYLLMCINELNKIYESFGLPLILKK
jgi:hypothetical protein